MLIAVCAFALAGSVSMAQAQSGGIVAPGGDPVPDEPPPATSTGASLTAVTPTVVVAGLLLSVPSLATKAMVRGVVLGFCEVLA